MLPVTVLRVLRLSFAGLALAAIVDQFASRSTGSAFEALNFFSFFTVQANLLGVAVLGMSALGLPASPARRGVLRGAAVFALVLTGLVFAILLTDVQEDLQLTKPWVNTVLHQVMPVVVVLDWVLDPPGRRLTWRAGAAWLAFPAVWTLYTLARGAITGWYPYPFIDPALHGAGRVVANCATIFVGMLVMVALLVVLGNRGQRRGAPARSALSEARR